MGYSSNNMYSYYYRVGAIDQEKNRYCVFKRLDQEDYLASVKIWKSDQGKVWCSIDGLSGPNGEAIVFEDFKSLPLSVLATLFVKFENDLHVPKNLSRIASSSPTSLSNAGSISP